MYQLESKVDEKDKTMRKLKGTVNELASAVAQREMHARRHQAKSENQARQQKREQERVHCKDSSLRYGGMQEAIFQEQGV